MRRTSLFLTALALSCGSVYAGGIEVAPPPACCFDGFYAGAAIGASVTSFRVNNRDIVTVTADNLPPFEPFPTTSVTNSVVNRRFLRDSVLGNVFLGYGRTFNSFYLGGEVFGNFADRTSNNTASAVATNTTPFGVDVLTATASSRYRLNNGEPGIDARIGYLIAPCTLPYFRIGVSFNRIRVSESEAIATTTPSPFNPQPTSFNYSRSVAGFRIGGGLEQMVFNGFSLRADYIYTNYGTLNRTTVVNQGPASNEFIVQNRQISNNARVNVHSHSMLFGLVYHLAV